MLQPACLKTPAWPGNQGQGEQREYNGFLQGARNPEAGSLQLLPTW